MTETKIDGSCGGEPGKEGRNASPAEKLYRAVESGIRERGFFHERKSAEVLKGINKSFEFIVETANEVFQNAEGDKGGDGEKKVRRLYDKAAFVRVIDMGSLISGDVDHLDIHRRGVGKDFPSTELHEMLKALGCLSPDIESKYPYYRWPFGQERQKFLEALNTDGKLVVTELERDGRKYQRLERQTSIEGVSMVGFLPMWDNDAFSPEGVPIVYDFSLKLGEEFYLEQFGFSVPKEKPVDRVFNTEVR